jgi:hypothetical protein
MTIACQRGLIDSTLDVVIAVILFDPLKFFSAFSRV